MPVWQNGGSMEPLVTTQTCIAIPVVVEVWLPQNPHAKN